MTISLGTATRLCFYVAMRWNGDQKIPKIPDVLPEEHTPLVDALLEICLLFQEQVQSLKDEIARLKGLKPKPEIKPSALEDKGARKKGRKRRKRRRRSSGRRKTHRPEIHETIVVPPDSVPEGSRFKGYQDFTVQDLVIRAHNTLYRLARWETPSGEAITGALPAELGGSHFGPMLNCFILYQYYHAHVTQPLITEQLLEFGISISSGQVSRIITEGKERYHAEKDEILRVGLEVSGQIHVDDTGARHQGRNGYCTHIGNELFAWFASTESKSRINFLELLRAGRADYVLNEEALEYMREQKLPRGQIEKLAGQRQKAYSNKGQWDGALESLGITGERHVRIATEGALLGSILDHQWNPRLAIISDDAGQFNVLLHGLCWIHAERTVKKLVGFNKEHRAALALVRGQIWDFYDDLKAYKQAPTEAVKSALDARFDELFTQKTCFASLNLALTRIQKNKAELLLVLERPDISLHNNLSEQDIREYVKKRKISGSTRSDSGRRCRDTFTSLKKTCRKLGLSFWEYLADRVSGRNRLPSLAETMRQHAQASSLP